MTPNESDCIQVSKTFHNMLGTLVHRHIINQGRTPTEIWIGPDWLEIFKKHMNDMRHGKGSVPIINDHCDGLAQYSGMTIRFMKAKGLRVGYSVSTS